MAKISITERAQAFSCTQSATIQVWFKHSVLPI